MTGEIPREDLAAAAGQLHQKLATSVRAVINSTLAAFEFDWKQRDHSAEIARQIRLKRHRGTPSEADITDIICDTLAAFDHDHDRAEVGAEVNVRWCLRPGSPS
jgi:hypothetical protein